MKKNRMIVSVFACLIFGTWAEARPQQAGPQARAKLRDNINTLRLLRMTEALELTEEQTAKLFPALTRIEREKSDLQRRMGTEIRDLRAALEKEPVREADVLAMVKRIRDIRQSIKEKDGEFEATLDESLTPVQKGKYLLFLVDFAKGLGEKLNRVRQIRGKN